MKPTAIRTSTIRFVTTGIFAMLGVQPATAQLTINTTSGTVTQSFDTLVSSGNTTWTDNSTISGWYAQRTGNGTTVVADVGSSTAGNLYSYGSLNSSDRALGSLGSGNVAAGSFAWGVLFHNVSGSPISLGLLSYVGEQWRSAGATTPAQSVAFSYQIATSAISNLTPNSAVGWTPLTALNFTTPVFNTTAGALNGNLSANRVALSHNLDLTLQPNEYIMFRWHDPDHAGTDHGLAIDDFSFTWGSVIPLLYWSPNGPGTAGGDGVWDTATGNWNTTATGDGSAEIFTSANPAVFGGAAGTVSIDAAGVTANAGVRFESPDYSIEGGPLTLGAISTITTAHSADTLTTVSAPIHGTSGLTKAGPGALLLEAANSFTGNVTLAEGDLVITTEENLGAETNGIAFAGGRLIVADAMLLGAGRTLTGNGKILVAAEQVLEVTGEAALSSLALSGAGLVALEGSTRNVGSIAFTEGGTLTSTIGPISATDISVFDTTGTATIAVDLNLGSALRTVNVADGPDEVDLVITGSIAISGGNTDRLQKLGAGTLRLEGNNSSLASSVRIGNAGAAPSAGGTVEITNRFALGNNPAVEIQFNDGVLRATEDLTGADAIPLGLSLGAGQGAPATFAGGDMEFSGAASLFRAPGQSYMHRIVVENTTTFAGGLGVSSTATGGNPSLGLTITGSGKLVLSAATNAIQEPIFVNGPTLAVNGSLAAETLTVQSGTLSGSGTIAGNTLITSGAFLAPGDGAGTLTFSGDLDLSDAVAGLGTEALQFELGDSSDLVALTAGQLTLGAGLLEFDDFAFMAGPGFGAGTYALFVSAVAIDGILGDFVTGNVGGLDATLMLTEGNTQLVLEVVPEPGTAALLLGGLACLAARRRRR